MICRNLVLALNCMLFKNERDSIISFVLWVENIAMFD